MDIKVVTPDGVIYNKTAKSITLPTQSGVITVLDDHMPLISLLVAGEMSILENEDENGKQEKEEELLISVSTGIIEVQSESKVYILADTAERAEEIDIERAEEARKKAEEEIAKKDQLEDVDFAKLQAVIDREMARIQVGKRYKKLRNLS